MPRSKENADPTVEIVENNHTESASLARYEQPVQDLALTPVFNVAEAKKRMAELQEFVKSYLVADEDYGVIPGTPKPTLYKSGADKLCDVYGLADEYRITNRVEDWNRDLFDYEVECVLRSKRSGQVVATGLGSCNSYESKYRWRESQRKCPKCGKESIIKGKQEYGGGWLCFAKKGGCGAKFNDADPAITGQQVGRVQNDDIATLKNTLLKMATKRAKIAAVLGATRSSALFTQDMEDISRSDESEERNTPPPAANPIPKQSAKTTAPTQVPKPAAAQPPRAEVPPEPMGQTRTAPEPAPAKTKSRGERAREICTKAGTSTNILMTFLCKHLNCDPNNIATVPPAQIEGVLTGIEFCLEKYPNAGSSADMVRKLLCDEANVPPLLKNMFLQKYAEAVK